MPTSQTWLVSAYFYMWTQWSQFLAFITVTGNLDVVDLADLTCVEKESGMAEKAVH